MIQADQAMADDAGRTCAAFAPAIRLQSGTGCLLGTAMPEPGVQNRVPLLEAIA